MTVPGILAGVVAFSIPSGPGVMAQTYAPDAFLDPTAATLFQSAQSNWLGIDSSVVRYTAVIKQRIAAGIRTPLKDRTLYRNETAVRAFWDRDHAPIIQVLGAKAQHPGRETARREGGLSWLDELAMDDPFEPGGDRLLFGIGDQDDEIYRPDNEDFWLAHPLAGGADTLYRFQSGDTLTLSFPDGRRLLTVQLDVLPREADVHRLSGTLWIEPETGALVRAVYRLARQFDVMRDVPEVREEEEAGEFRMVPGIFKPWTFDMNVVAIDYSLWEFKVWLPRSMRIEGEAAAGVLKFPVSMDMAYQIEAVTTEDDLVADAPAEEMETLRFESRAEAMAYLSRVLGEQDGVEYELAEETRSSNDRTTRFLVPEDRTLIERSIHLPPPIWDDAPGFASEEELKETFETLADLPQVPMAGIPLDFNWGWARHDLLRYNRVEGPAVGGRFEAELGGPLGPWTLQTSGFFGFADFEPKARVGFERATVKRRLTFAAYRELHATDPKGRYLGLGNSLYSLLFGRDDGEYYMATGADFLWRPPEAARQSMEFRAYVERQHRAKNNIDFAIFRAFDGSDTFRPNVDAEKVEEAGGELYLAPWWGTDPLAPQVGLEMYGHAATWRQVDSTTTTNFARASAILRVAIPLASDTWKVGLEAGGGTTWGDAPFQRNWFLGGPSDLRGYSASTLVGPSFARGRIEIARTWPEAYTISVFGDAGWAGLRDEFDADDLLYGAGVGASLLDGLIRFDLSHGLTGPDKQFRVDLYLDAIL